MQLGPYAHRLMKCVCALLQREIGFGQRGNGYGLEDSGAVQQAGGGAAAPPPPMSKALYWDTLYEGKDSCAKVRHAQILTLDLHTWAGCLIASVYAGCAGAYCMCAPCGYGPAAERNTKSECFGPESEPPWHRCRACSRTQCMVRGVGCAPQRRDAKTHIQLCAGRLL